MEDPQVQAVNPTSVTYVARYEPGSGNHFGLFYFGDDPVRYWSPGDPKAFHVGRGLFMVANPRPDRMVVVLRLSLVTDEITLNVFYDQDADPWFVAPGDEETLADMAR